MVGTVAFSPDGREVLTADQDGTARLYDAATGAERNVYGGHLPKQGTARFCSGGRRILSSADNGATAEIGLWDAAGQRMLRSFACPGTVGSLALSPDGRHFLSAGHDGTVRLWELPD